jgi:ElaB/YqjD/DUF883 family membrane-anchored ribosome-binding protein
MNLAENTVLREAELDVQKSNQEFDNTVSQLKNKLNESVNTLNRYTKAAKNPLVLIAMGTAVGFFFGKMLARSFRKTNY